MTELIDTLRAIVRDELARRVAPELGVVTTVHARDGDSSDANHQVNVRLAATGIELQHVPVLVGRLGLAMLPQVDDTVLVVFVGGDLNAPLVVGSVYDAKVQPPVAKAGEVVYEPSDAGGDAMCDPQQAGDVGRLLEGWAVQVSRDRQGDIGVMGFEVLEL